MKTEIEIRLDTKISTIRLDLLSSSNENKKLDNKNSLILNQVKNILNGLDRKLYPSIKNKILKNINDKYSVDIINISFQYKINKLTMMVDLLPFTIIKDIVKMVNGKLENKSQFIIDIRNCFQDQNKSQYKKDILKIIENYSKVETKKEAKEEAKIDYDTELINIKLLSIDDKIKIFEYLKIDLNK